MVFSTLPRALSRDHQLSTRSYCICMRCSIFTPENSIDMYFHLEKKYCFFLNFMCRYFVVDRTIMVDKRNSWAFIRSIAYNPINDVTEKTLGIPTFKRYRSLKVKTFSQKLNWFVYIFTDFSIGSSLCVSYTLTCFTIFLYWFIIECLCLDVAENIS
jgi:hypothetical protein